jgi:hypothetical protein
LSGRLVALLPLALSAVIAVGCQKKVSSGTVQGKVSSKKVPIGFGTVVFFASADDTIVGKGAILPDGTYQAEVLTGPVRVAVYLLGQPPGNMDMATMMKMMEKAEKEGSPETKAMMEKMAKEVGRKKGGMGPPPAKGPEGVAVSPEMMKMMGKMKMGKGGGPSLPPGAVPGALTPAFARMSPDMKAELRKLEAKYAGPEKSGLTLEVSAEEQTFDIPLTLK